MVEVIHPLLLDRCRPARAVAGHSYETPVVKGTRGNPVGRAFVHAARAAVTHPYQDLKLNRVQRDIANRHASIVHSARGRAQRSAGDFECFELRVRDVFTYPVSDGDPSIIHYHEKVADRLRTIATQDGLHLNRIDPYEVQECLNASIFGH